MNTLRLRAEHGAQKFYNKRQNEPLEALAGDGAGNVTPTAKHGSGWDYVRIGGNADDVHETKNSSGHTFSEDDSVLISWVKRTGLGFYEIIGYSGSAVYDNPSDTTQTTVLAHAPQHERRDAGQGGFDPLDIYARMVVPLRARPQTSPNLTLHVEAGYNPLTGNYYAGGDSAAFVPPVGLAQAEIDLLYLGDDDALHIVAGTPAVGGSPALPALVLPSVPLAFVYLAVGQTTITESNIYRDPGILRSPVFTAGASAPHDLLDGSIDQDTVAHAVAEDDLIVGTAAPKWDGLAKGADRSYVGVNPATSHVAYLSPLVFNVIDYGAVGNGIANDTTAVQAAINAANGAGGGIVFFPPGTYSCNPLTAYKTVWMVGAGAAASIIQARAAGSLITWLAAAAPLTFYGGFRDLTLDGNSTGTNGLDLTGATTFEWERLVIKNFTGIGAKLRACLIGELDDCYFTTNATGVDIDQYAFGGGLGTIESNLLKFNNCRFDTNSAWAIHSDNSSVLALDKCDLEVNGTAGNATTGTVYYKSATDNMLGLVVKDCWFESIEGKAGIVFDIPRTTNVQCEIQDTLFSASINSTYGIYVNGTSTAQKVICRNVEFYDDAGSGDFYADGANATLDLHYCLGTTGGAGTINSYPPYGGTPAGPDKSVQYDNAGAFGAVGVNATATKKYLQQVSSGTPSFEQVDYADLSGVPSAGAASDHLHGLARWNADGGTTFELPDCAEYLEWASDNGTLVDPSTLSLATSNTQLVFGTAPTAGHWLAAEYVIQRI